MSDLAPTAAPPIPVVLVGLKLKLLRNRSRQRGGALGMVLGAIGALAFGAFGFASTIAAAHNDDPRIARAVVVIGATAVVLGWALLPLVTFGTDETLDPARLQLLPIERRPLLLGLLAASLVGYAPFAVLVTMVGVIAGYASGAGAIVTIFAVVILVVLAATTARALATSLASSLTSRRGRDAIVAFAAILGAGVQLIRFVHFIDIDAAWLDRVSDIVRWLPPGALGQAVIDSRTGHLARAFVELIPALVVIPVLLVVWGRTLERSLTVVTGGSTKIRGRGRTERRSSLFPRLLSFLPAKPWGAIAAKEIRYVTRDPRRRIVVGQLVLFGVGGPAWFALSARSLSPGSVLLASLAGYLALIGALNQFGFDGGALWLDIVAGNDIRAELLGKNAALLLQVIPVVLTGSVILAAVSGGWIYVPVALVIACAGLGAGLGVANVMSVRAPQRIPETRSPFGGGAGGDGCVTAVLLFLGMIAQGLLLVPVVVAAGITAAQAPAALVVVAPACALYGYVLWRTGVNRAVRWAWWRQPELLLAVDARRGA
jgi:hypothetical protein